VKPSGSNFEIREARPNPHEEIGAQPFEQSLPRALLGTEIRTSMRIGKWRGSAVNTPRSG